MAVTASQVKELRTRTGAGMMDCKKALSETDGDIDKAIEALRKKGLAKAGKRAGNSASEGALASIICNECVCMIELNCETDFVARGDKFQQLAKLIVKIACQQKAENSQAVLDTKLSSVDEAALAEIKAILPNIEADKATVSDFLQEVSGTTGEKIDLRRVELLTIGANQIAESYLHSGRILAVTVLEGGSSELAKDIAMHVAASNPQALDKDSIDPALVEKEKEIFTAQAAQSGKPPEIIEKMIGGRINKFLKEVTLVGQPFVKDPDVTVEKLLKNNSAKVIKFVRYELGEGIEKKVDDFAAEVMAQVNN